MQHVGKLAPGVADIEAEIVGDGHILDGMVKALAGVPRLQAPRRVDGPVHAGDEFMLRHRVHIHVDGRIPRVRLGCAKVHVFDESALRWRRHARRWTAGRTSGEVGQCRSDYRVVY